MSDVFFEALTDFKFNDRDRYNDFWLNKFNFDKKNKSKEYKAYDVTIPETLNIDVATLINNHIPNSFAIKTKFRLTSSLHIKDDGEFYIISNSMLKEKVFKIPMIRGSSWKGALLNGAREIIKEEQDTSKKVEHLSSYFRVFGVGDDSFRNIVDKVNDNDFKLFFMLNGLAIDVDDEVKKIFERYKESKAQKGRAIFYPTYFDKLSLEVINPHDKKTKAGTNPIFYEVVPKGSEGELQIVYIPFDGVLKTNEEIKKQAEQDLAFLQKCVNKVAQNGIGAKTKLGWGRFVYENIINEIYPLKKEKATCVWSER